MRYLRRTRRLQEGRCQSKFYTDCLRIRMGQSSTVFAHESPTRSAGFDAENGLYSFALTVPRQRLAVATRRSSFASSEKAARAVCPQGAACRPSGTPSTDRSITRRPCPRAGALRAPLGDTVGLSVDLPSPRFCGTRAIGAAYALSRRPLSSASRPFIGDLEGQQRGEVSHSRPISTLALRVTITIREGILKYEIRDGASVKSGPIRRV